MVNKPNAEMVIEPHFTMKAQSVQGEMLVAETVAGILPRMPNSGVAGDVEGAA